MLRKRPIFIRISKSKQWSYFDWATHPSLNMNTTKKLALTFLLQVLNGNPVSSAQITMMEYSFGNFIIVSTYWAIKSQIEHPFQ